MVITAEDQFGGGFGQNNQNDRAGAGSAFYQVLASFIEALSGGDPQEGMNGPPEPEMDEERIEQVKKNICHTWH